MLFGAAAVVCKQIQLGWDVEVPQVATADEVQHKPVGAGAKGAQEEH